MGRAAHCRRNIIHFPLLFPPSCTTVVTRPTTSNSNSLSQARDPRQLPTKTGLSEAVPAGRSSEGFFYAFSRPRLLVDVGAGEKPP